MLDFDHSFAVPVRWLLVGFTATAISSCSFAGLNPFTGGQPSPPTTAASPSTPTTGQSGITDVVEQPTSCETVNYFSEVIWENGQPRMTLVQRASEANGYVDTTNLNKAIATRTLNSDRSLTYASPIEGGTIFTRVFPNADCFIQSVATNNGAIVFEENGRIRGSSASTSVPVSETSSQDETPVIEPAEPANPNQGRPPVVDPTGPINPPPPKPPVVDPTGPIKPPSPKPPVVDPTGPIKPPPKPPVVDPPGPTKPNPIKTPPIISTPTPSPVPDKLPTDLTRPALPR